MVVVKQKCYICNEKADFVIDDDAVLLREAVCSNCGTSIRNNDIVEVISEKFCNGKSINISETDLKELRILNTSSCGPIHNCLKHLPNYICSEFFDNIENGETNEQGILCLDLCNIKFDDNTFDIIISEDILEHIKNPEIAFAEIERVLKNSGLHIFTIPFNESGVSKQRDENVRQVYHGDGLREEGILVYNEFSWDINKFLPKPNKNKLIIKKAHIFYKENEVTDLDRDYNEYLEKKNLPLQFYKYNSIVGIQYKENKNENKQKRKYGTLFRKIKKFFK